MNPSGPLIHLNFRPLTFRWRFLHFQLFDVSIAFLFFPFLEIFSNFLHNSFQSSVVKYLCCPLSSILFSGCLFRYLYASASEFLARFILSVAKQNGVPPQITQRTPWPSIPMAFAAG